MTSNSVLFVTDVVSPLFSFVERWGGTPTVVFGPPGERDVRGKETSLFTSHLVNLLRVPLVTVHGGSDGISFIKGKCSSSKSLLHYSTTVELRGSNQHGTLGRSQSTRSKSEEKGVTDLICSDSEPSTLYNRLIN